RPGSAAAACRRHRWLRPGKCASPSRRPLRFPLGISSGNFLWEFPLGISSENFLYANGRFALPFVTTGLFFENRRVNSGLTKLPDASQDLVRGQDWLAQASRP